jgi:hypothetical protein
MVCDKVVFKNNNLNAKQKHNTQKIQNFKMCAISKEQGESCRSRGGQETHDRFRDHTKLRCGYYIYSYSTVPSVPSK